MTDTTRAPITDIASIARYALTRAAEAVAGDDVTMAERWLKVARSAGFDPALTMETKAENIAERRISRDRLMAVLARRFERISLQMQDGAERAHRLPALGSYEPPC